MCKNATRQRHLSFRVRQKRVLRMFQSGSAKLMLPKTYSDMMEAVILNTSGGMTDGDILDIDVEVEGCALVMTTQTADVSIVALEQSLQRYRSTSQSLVPQIYIGYLKKRSYSMTPVLNGH